MDLRIDRLRVAAKQYRKVCTRTSTRFVALIELAKRMARTGDLSDLDYERVAIDFQVCTRTLKRWKSAYEQEGVKGVVPKVSPGRRAKPITGYIAKKILEYRRKYRWGAEVIQVHLKLDHEIDVSQGRINRFLRRKKLIRNKFVSHVDKPKKHVFDRMCEKNGIRHVLIPPGEKELQGLVERSHRMDDDELYHRIRPNDVADFNRFLEPHCEWKNSRRRRKSLDWKAPNQWLKDYEEKILSGIVRPDQQVNVQQLKPNEDLNSLENRGHQSVESTNVVAIQSQRKSDLNGLSETRQNFCEEQPCQEALSRMKDAA